MQSGPTQRDVRISHRTQESSPFYALLIDFYLAPFHHRHDLPVQHYVH